MQAGCDRASTPRALCHIPSCILAAPCLRHARHRTSNDEPLDGISVFGDRLLDLWQEKHGALPPVLVELLQGEARWDVRMTAWLLYVRMVVAPQQTASGALWRAYLALLPPRHAAPCLLNYGPEAAVHLQVPAAIQEAAAQYAWAKSVHERYFARGAGSTVSTLGLAPQLDDTLWAMSMVRTRTFSEAVNGESITLMVPYADLANHSFAYNSTFCMALGNKRFELRSLEALPKGAELTISYGEDKPNSETMRDYGFCVPANPNDRIGLTQASASVLQAACSSSSIPSSSSSGSSNGATAPLVALPLLNAASLMQCVGFEGDVRTPDSLQPVQSVQPVSTSSSTHGSGTAVLAKTSASKSSSAAAAAAALSSLRQGRRRSVLLSLPLSDGLGSTLIAPQPGSTDSSTSSTEDSKSGSGGTFGGWPPRAWTSSGQAPAQPLANTRGSHSEEADRAAVLQKALLAELAAFPTTVQQDQAVLLELEEGGQGSTVDVVQHGLLEAAVRFRLEHKMLLHEAVCMMMDYGAWLQDRHGH